MLRTLLRAGLIGLFSTALLAGQKPLTRLQPLDEIDQGSYCYREPLALNANINDLKSAFNANNWLQTITGVYARRWPSGKALAQAQANDPYFKDFVETQSFNKFAESMMVAIHEETHMWDLANSRSQWNEYTSAWIDDQTQFIKLPLYDQSGGFPRKEILSLIKDDASQSMDEIYLKNAQQGEYHLHGVIAELNAGLMGLPAALAMAEFIDGIGASNARDIALTNLNYLQLYLRVAKSKYPAYFAKLKSDTNWRKFVLIEFLRTSYFITQSEAHAQKLGSNKVPALIQRVYASENIAILEEFSGYRFPRDIRDFCMGRVDNGAPVITQHPSNLVLSIGQNGQFNVSASGGTLNYLWRKNGQDLSNSNNPHLSLNNVQESDAGQYQVEVSNAQGKIQSNSASLTVNPVLISVEINPKDVKLKSNAIQTFTAKVNGTSNQGVQWSIVESNGGTINTSGLYTAPSQGGPFHIRAHSTVNPKQFGEALVTLIPEGDGIIKGKLNGPGSSLRLPSGTPNYWNITTTRSLSFQLIGPATADFDLYLYRWNGKNWVQVSKSEGPSAQESIQYQASAGRYYLLIKAYSGAGEFTLNYRI